MTHEEILAAVPQQAPFRFIDEIIQVDADAITATCRFREDADFYKGHFPGNPVTPGVLLVEAMAQAGLVAHAIYLLSDDPGDIMPVFTEANVEFLAGVAPGETVRIHARKRFFRMGKLSSEVEMYRVSDDKLVCSGTLAGMMVAR
ncbi:MAG: AfsA-related hotdog domain-containing protein [Deltaproteobacteria bacterium]